MNVEEFRKTLGHRIMVRRVELKLHQKELAERIGLSQTHISQWELGIRPMRIEQGIVLAKALNTTLCALAESENQDKLEL